MNEAKRKLTILPSNQPYLLLLIVGASHSVKCSSLLNKSREVNTSVFSVCLLSILNILSFQCIFDAVFDLYTEFQRTKRIIRFGKRFTRLKVEIYIHSCVHNSSLIFSFRGFDSRRFQLTASTQPPHRDKSCISVA